MIGNEIYQFAEKLWPFDRSITGPGLRKTLSEIKDKLPNLKNKHFATGTKVFDWTIPQEWEVNEAHIISPSGAKICDFNTNNLHLVGYSTSYNGKMSLKELQKYLFSIPNQPDAIPYITSYYQKRWGFCLTHEQRTSLEDGQYEIVIDTSFKDGNLDYGELLIEGKNREEIFLSTYICHPSMANNELSGPTVLTFIAKWIQELPERRYSYRIIFIPETIGSISYLSKNYKYLQKHVVAGFNVTCIGDERSYSYLPSRNGKTLSDVVAKHVLKWTDKNYKTYTWSDRGSDERQYCAPGIDLPVASIMRSKYNEYPEYHTSLDDLQNVVTPNGLEGGYWALRRAIETIEKNEIYKVTTLCEPQLGKRGLYPTISTKNSKNEVRLLMDIITYCDGEHSLLEIAEIINVPIWELYEKIEILLKEKLIKRI